LLDRVEETLRSILVMPVDSGETRSNELSALPSKRVALLIPGAIRERDNIAFALK
jgi:multidrug resistance protein MdtO